MKKTPIVGIAPDGKEYLFNNFNAALNFVNANNGGSSIKELEKMLNGMPSSEKSTLARTRWKFRYLDNYEKEIYEKVLCESRRQEYGPDPRPESSTTNSGE